MGRLVKIHNGETLIAHTRVDYPTYTIYVEDYAGGETPPDGWVYFAENVERSDFAPAWVQPTRAGRAYALGEIVTHNNARWRSLIVGNVWEPGVSGWRQADQDVPTWIQPTGAHDAYTKDAVVLHNQEFWTSLLDANVWEPGVSGWRKAAIVPPSGEIPVPAWVQPTGAQDAYPLGARVTHNGQTWESTVADNVWEPGVYGWVVV